MLKKKSVLCRDWSVSADGAEEPCGLVSPNSSARGLAKELQHSLDLASATSGNKVVTAQVSWSSSLHLTHTHTHKFYICVYDVDVMFVCV